ncbi:MAG: hypothetical protein K8S16_16880, partial [Bacteroidales bacterium]|nr:hypothetical protein [Bacteroidales bacterium]
MTKVNKHLLICEISDITGKSFENSMHSLNNFMPPVVNQFENIDFSALNQFSTVNHISSTNIAKSISKITGSSFENVLM